MSETIPDQMRAVLLDAYHDDLARAVDGLRVDSRPVPRPKRGQVLVRMEASPCNPSDLLFLQGQYGVLKTLPSVPGWEGAGTVVAVGGGMMARWLAGKRVACGCQGDKDGTWAEYFLAEATECVPLKDNLTIQQGASLLINPLTAMGLLDTARRNGHGAGLQTAGASQLGRMLVALAKDIDFPLVSVVRRQEQVELMRTAGAQYVLNSEQPGFGDELRALCKELRATVAFDAVAGALTGHLLDAMPRGSTVLVYGALSGSACGGIDPIGLIFQSKSVAGFYLSEWIQKLGMWRTLGAANRVQRLLASGQIQTAVQRTVGLEQIREGLGHYVNHMTEGKILIKPDEADNLHPASSWCSS